MWQSHHQRQRLLCQAASAPSVLIGTRSCFLTSGLLHFTFGFSLCAAIHIHMYHADANTDSFCLQQPISICCHNRTTITPIQGYLPSIHTVVFLYSFYRHMSLQYTGFFKTPTLLCAMLLQQTSHRVQICCFQTCKEHQHGTQQVPAGEFSIPQHGNAKMKSTSQPNNT